MRMVLAATAMLACVGVAGAQTPSPSPSGMASEAKCAAPAKLTGEYAGWAKPVALTSAKAKMDLAKAQLTVGKAVNLTLLATPDIDYPTQPEKPGGSVSKGGLVSFKVDTAGTYFVALGGPPWIDVVDKDGKTYESVAHGHGPDCSGIRKMVDFKLTPGTYTLQISSANMAQMDVMVGKR